MGDISTISESTGLSISEATTLKKHLFFGQHSLPVGSSDGVTFQLSRFTADDEIAFAWQRAQKGNLSTNQQDWFRQLADHELAERQFMAQGVPYRNPQSYNPQTGFGQIPPGAHDIAPPPAPYGTFPGFYDWLLKNAF